MSEPTAPDWCEKNEMPASMCAHCRPPVVESNDLIPQDEVVARFTARYTGEECEGCDRTLVEGSPICRLVDGGYAHEHCTEPWPTVTRKESWKL